MKRYLVISILLLAGALLGFSAHAQTAPCTLAQAGIKFKNPAGIVLDWWPKTTLQPTAGTVEVVGGNLALQVLVVKPAPAQIKAGVAPDALGFCIPLAQLARGDEFAVMLTVDGQPKRVATCRFELGDLYNFRNYGTPAKKLATVEPRVVQVGTISGLCTGSDLTEPPTPSPPVVVTLPPAAGGTWVQVATEHKSFAFVGPVRFGAPGAWVEKVAAGYFMCNETGKWFGTDPAPDRPKVCEAFQQ